MQINSVEASITVIIVGGGMTLTTQRVEDGAELIRICYCNLCNLSWYKFKFYFYNSRMLNVIPMGTTDKKSL